MPLMTTPRWVCMHPWVCLSYPMCRGFPPGHHLSDLDGGEGGAGVRRSSKRSNPWAACPGRASARREDSLPATPARDPSKRKILASLCQGCNRLRGHELVVDRYTTPPPSGTVKGDDETHRVLAHDGDAIALGQDICWRRPAAFSASSSRVRYEYPDRSPAGCPCPGSCACCFPGSLQVHLVTPCCIQGCLVRHPLFGCFADQDRKTSGKNKRGKGPMGKAPATTGLPCRSVVPLQPGKGQRITVGHTTTSGMLVKLFPMLTERLAKDGKFIDVLDTFVRRGFAGFSPAHIFRSWRILPGV
jgi:hypothetical protein